MASIHLANKTGNKTKEGYLAKVIKGGFDYCDVGDTPIGIVAKKELKGRSTLIKNTGTVKAYLSKEVAEGEGVRQAVAGEGVPLGTLVPIGDATSFTYIGRALESGKGLVEIFLDISQSGTAAAASTTTVLSTIVSGGSAPAPLGWNLHLGSAAIGAPVGGIFRETISDGENLSFSGDGTWIAVTYDGANNVLHFDLDNVDALDTRWNLMRADGQDPIPRPILEEIEIGNTANVVFLNGVYTTVDMYRNLTFTDYDPPIDPAQPANELTIDINTTALNTWLQTLYYTETEIDGFNFISEAASDSIAYSRYNGGWVNANLIIDRSGGTGAQTAIVNYDERLTIVGDGTYISSTYSTYVNGLSQTIHEIEISLSPTLLDTEWFLMTADGEIASARSYTRQGIRNDANVAFLNGAYTTVSYFLNSVTGDYSPALTNPVNEITVEVDHNQMNSDGIFYSQSEVDGLLTGFLEADYTQNGTIWGHRDGAWTSAEWTIDYSGGSGTSTASVGHDGTSGNKQRVTFVGDGTYISTGYTYASDVHEIEISFSPTGFYQGWDPLADAGTGYQRVGSAHDVTFAGGTSITTTYSYATAHHTITFDLSTALLVTTIDEAVTDGGVTIEGVEIIDSAITGYYDSTYIDNNFDDYVSWDFEYDTVTPQAKAINSGDSFGIVGGTDIGTSWDGVNNRLTINYAGGGSAYTGWNLKVDASAQNLIQNAEELVFTAGTGITLNYTVGAGTNEIEIVGVAASPWTADASGITYASGDVGIGITSATNYQTWPARSLIVGATGSSQRPNIELHGNHSTIGATVGALSIHNEQSTAATKCIAQIAARVASADDDEGIIVFQVANTSGTLTDVVTINSSGDIAAIGEVESYDTSDINLKDNIERLDVEYIAKEMLSSSLISYNHKIKDKREVGWIAQEIEMFLPENIREDGDGNLMIHYGKMGVALSAVDRYQQNEIEALQAEVKELKRKLSKY